MSIFEELRVLDDHDAPRSLCFASSGLLLWPFVRAFAFGIAQDQALGLQTAFATDRRRSVGQSAELVVRSMLRGPLSAGRPFDVVIIGSSAGLVLKRDDRWFDRINDYFAMELPERTLVLDRAELGGYKTPRFPPHVRCFDTFEIRAGLEVRLARRRPRDEDLAAIERLLGFIRERFPVGLSGASLDQVRAQLVNWALRLPILHRMYARFFDEIRPRVIVMEDGSSGGFAHVCTWARAAGIATAEPQHGVIARSHLVYNVGDARNDEAFASSMPRYLLVYGEFWSAQVRTSSEPVAVGCPHFSETARSARPAADSVLVISQGTRTAAMVQLTAAIARRFPARRVVFRVHPGELSFPDRYASLGAIANVEISDRGDIYEQFHDAAVVVGHSSAALVEAAGVGLPVLVLDDEASRAFVPAGVGTWFKTADEVVSLVISPPSISTDPERFFAGGWRERYRSFIASVV